MANSGTMMKTPFLDDGTQRSNSSRTFKVGIALVGGSCLALLAIMAMPALITPGSSESMSLLGMPTSLRTPGQMTMRNLPGHGPFKELALAAIQANGRCDRDGSTISNRMKTVMESMSSADRDVVAKAEVIARAAAPSVLGEVGVTAPMGFFDPQGFSAMVPEGQLLFWREAEIKHARVCMLAFLGIIVAENYTPLFGGNAALPAAAHFTQVGPGGKGFGGSDGFNGFWVAAWLQFMVASFWEERRTMQGVLDGKAVAGMVPNDNPELFSAVGGRIPGDLGFDPLGLKPKNAKDLLQMQNKELNNGRLAMFAVAGIIGQELVTGQKIFDLR